MSPRNAQVLVQLQFAQMFASRQQSVMHPRLQQDYEMSVNALSNKFRVAQTEREIWSQGRLAYKAFGSSDYNPFEPDTAEYEMWLDGFDHEKQQKRNKWDMLLNTPL